MTCLDLNLISQIAAKEGVCLIGRSDSSQLAQDIIKLRAWQQEGMAGQLDYMLRDAEVYGNPLELLSGARSVLSFAFGYENQSPQECPQGQGKVARYAWGRDYHKILKKTLERVLMQVLTMAGFKFDYRVVVDAAPLLERALGVRGKLGFIGKNTMLIRPGVGSYFLLAEVILSCDVRGDLDVVRSKGCSSCTRCLDSCPTQAIKAPYIIDARKCISYLTIEKRGSFEVWERRALGCWVFGCDVCQEVCPFNHRGHKGAQSALVAIGKLRSSSGAGPLLDLAHVLSMRTEEQFLKVFSGTALTRSKRHGLLRNCACVAANTDSFALVPLLVEASQQDSSEIVRQHALWALIELKKKSGEIREARHLAERYLNDTSPLVQNEARSLLDNE